MSKNNITSDFVREAVREKASRDLATLQHRTEAFGSIERARDAIFTVTTELTTAAAALSAFSSDREVPAKEKKLRKVIEDANTLVTDIADALGIDAHRDALATARQSILDALKSAGIDPAHVLQGDPGDAQ